MVYELYRFSHILITQPDVVIFRDDLKKWIKIDYVEPLKNKRLRKCKSTCCNGGISLRKIKSFLDSSII